MIKTRAGSWTDMRPPATDAAVQSAGSRSPLLSSVVVMCLLGMIILLPENFLALPFNTGLVDFWNVLVLSACWLYLFHMRHSVRLPYIVPMWLILVGSLLGAFAARDLGRSSIVVLKEVYLYAWFVTLAAFLATLDGHNLRRVMLTWSGVVILHGLLLVGQFLSPEIWRSTTTFLGQYGSVDAYRPSGLSEDPNWSALFQLMGFVPLLLAGLRRRTVAILGFLLALSIVATGSMGASLAFVCALTVAVLATLILSRHLGRILPGLVGSAAVALVAGGVFYYLIGQQPEHQARLESIYYGRAEKSSEGRFDLWQNGIDILNSKPSIWGIGPEAFRNVGRTGKQLHNDLLAFAVERGLVGTLGLLLFGTFAVSKAIRILQLSQASPGQARPELVIFLAAQVAILVESQFYQMFHLRAIWLFLALQEAMLFRLTAFGSELAPFTSSPSGRLSPRHAWVARRRIASG